jgi:hypothetical protein
MSGIAIALLVSCGGDSGVDDHVPFEVVTVTGLLAKTTYAVRTQAELERMLASTLKPWQNDPPQTLTIDFRQSMLIGVSLGLGRTCDGVRIREIVKNGPAYIVTYTQLKGSTTTACGLIEPLMAFVVAPQTNGGVSFVRDDG